MAEGIGRRHVLLVLASALVAFFMVPGTARAQEGGQDEEEKQRRSEIVIDSDAEFVEANGVRSGSGTHHDPYVIEGWQVSRVFIRDTDAYVVIRDNVIGTLTLNWNGDRVTVVNNSVADLRVNQNVRRTGEATSGLIAHNHFDVVGQLRHFDGIFSNNIVGTPYEGFEWPYPFSPRRAVLFDGFNGARFRNNTLYGYLGVKLHGHHHSSGFGNDSHYHGGGEADDHDAEVDHSRRYHQVLIANNRIHADGAYALRYYDTPHSVDDRTAASETDEALNQPHVHYTRVHVVDNQLLGAGLMVDVFNADDSRHTAVGEGYLELARNTITLERNTDEVMQKIDGITIRRAKGVKIDVVGNEIDWRLESDSPIEEAVSSDAGIRMLDLDQANIYLIDNAVAGSAFGIHASRFSPSVKWWIEGLATSGVRQPVYYDGSVANPPEEKP